jgi:hypothetical protein
MMNTVNHKHKDTWRIQMQIDISKNEAWKILDALASYKKDYALSGVVIKTIDSAIKKLKNAVDN